MGPCSGALSRLGPAFFVMYGDSYLECDFAAIEAAFHASFGKQGLMTVFRNDDRYDRSNVEYDDGRILRYDKKVQRPGDAAYRLWTGNSDPARVCELRRRRAAGLWRGCIRTCLPAGSAGGV